MHHIWSIKRKDDFDVKSWTFLLQWFLMVDHYLCRSWKDVYQGTGNKKMPLDNFQAFTWNARLHLLAKDYLLFPDEHCCKIQNTGRHTHLSKSSKTTVICWYQLILWQTQRSPPSPFAQPHKKDDDSALKSSALSGVQDTTDNMWPELQKVI